MPLFVVAVVAAFVSSTLHAADTALDPGPPARIQPERSPSLHDLRVYQAAPGKIDALHARLRDHQIPLLQQHGIGTQGVFTPAGENPDQRVYLLTTAEGLQGMEEGWAGLREDPTWLEVVAETEKDGPLVARESHQRLVTTSWSPVFPPEKSAKPQVFELRTYSCPDPSKHTALMRRFHNHTMKLFEKHGMQNVVYWVPDEQPESRQRLVYMLAHDSEEAAKESFAAFRKDPDWIAAKEASETMAGGSLTNREKGVVSEFLVATEYSPLR